jgi:hypothetical protein
MNYYIHPDRAKENCDGPFYTVDIGCDCGCGLPEELALAIKAVNLCPTHDIRYGGTDVKIIAKIKSGQSDYEINKSGVAVPKIQHT